jgi:hypothetical protein
VLVGALSSCSTAPTAEPHTKRTQVASTTAASTPTQSAAPTPSAAADPRDPSTWRITFTAIGPLTIGGDKAAEKALLTTYSEEPLTGDGPACRASFLRSSGAPSLIVADYHAVNRIDLLAVSGLIQGADPKTTYAKSAPSTAEGITIGSPVAQLLAAYPGITRTGTDPTFDGVTYGRQSGTRWMNFSVHTGVVDEIELSSNRTPAPEYCG